MKALKMLLWIPGILIGIYLAVLLYIYFNQTNMIFYPRSEFKVSPEDFNLSYEDVYLEIDHSTKIHGWYFPSDKPEDLKVVLFSHGNAGNISNRLETAKYLHELGVAVFMYDYRGYGKSTGSPTEEGVYADAEACYKWLVETKNIEEKNIFLFGRSLGGAVTIELAKKVNSGGIIVESSFTAVADVGKKMFPLFPIKFLIRYSFNSIDKIKSIKTPKLITHSPDDDLIPYEMGQKLFAEASEPKKFLNLSGGHNSLVYFESEEYKNALLNLFYSDSTE